MTARVPALPFVGRADELARLDSVLSAAAAGRGGTVLISGPGGVGKSRLVAAARELALGRGFTVAHGQAYPVEAGVPYALFADALVPAVRSQDPATLAVLTRGGQAVIAHLIPGLDPGEADAAVAPGEDPAEFKTRLLWNLTEFLRRLAGRRPLLIALEDVHWADASSLELLHFLARQTADDPIAFLCSYVDAERDRHPALRALEQSLAGLGRAQHLHVRALDRDETREIVCRAFDVDAAVAGAFASLLFDWTRGNPFFIHETLAALIESRQLRFEAGRWLGWGVERLALPATIRDVIRARIHRLGDAARATAELAAVIGARATFAALRAVSPLDAAALVAAVDELRAARILEEHADGRALVLDFVHPLIRETIYADLGIARTRLLHATVAEALESHHGAAAMTHADELAYHFARAEATDLAPRAVRYLVEAGRRALHRYANREAADYLSLALELVDRDPRPDGGAPDSDRAGALLVDLARARQRLGEHDEAVALLERARGMARAEGAARAVAALERRIGLALYWSGRRDDAVAHLTAGIASAERAGDDRLRASLLLARGTALLDGGDAQAGLADVEGALEIAGRSDDAALLARVHRGLLLVHTWAGNPDRARSHGALAVDLAARAAEPTVAFGAHWALAVLEGLIGETSAMRDHIAACERLADELRSPVLWLAMAETSIEYLAAVGDWDAAVGLGERAVALARSLHAHAILPRLLVWTGLLYLARDQLDRADALIDEAWNLAVTGNGADVHAIVSAHIGRAARHLWRQEYRDAVRIGEAGLDVADRSGYVFWAIHRLLPIVTESYCHLGDLEGARNAGTRLRREARRLGHKLGLAWADSADALLAWLGGDPRRGAELLRRACDSLDAIPIVLDSARLRRQLAGRLAEIGDREGAVRELRTVHEVFARLGVVRELDKARDQFREVGAKPPSRSVGEGTEALTAREVEIARLVARRRSNKWIGRELGISARTVSTHLSNVFRKLRVESRGELTDFVKAGGLLEK